MLTQGHCRKPKISSDQKEQQGLGSSSLSFRAIVPSQLRPLLNSLHVEQGQQMQLEKIAIFTDLGCLLLWARCFLFFP